MYIKELTIEGFKSYAQRVTLTNFDNCFNAITGLNGSGKSNILDSICFVLGISNLSQVRAQTLQELVYKQGQAGITKATVSITFHNDDPKTGPAGYEDKELIVITRQIVIGGRNKYMINGHAAQPTRVQDLFHSVQLNVNNPHFLIMQGRITKVLNMKPPEILSLLEEASGTRLYEKKKEHALRTLEKKQAKLLEIDQVISVELAPSLDKLREQCAKYHEYVTLSQSVEQLKRFCIAYEYYSKNKALEDSAAEVAELQTQVAATVAEMAQVDADLSDVVLEIKRLQDEKEMEAGGETRKLQKEADDLAIKVTEATTNLSNKQDSLASERAAHAQALAALKEAESAGLDAKLAAAVAEQEAAAEALKAAEQAVEAANREHAGVEAGDGRDESNRSMAERLADTEKDLVVSEGKAKEAEVRRKHASTQLSEQRKRLGAKTGEAAELQRQLADAQRQHDSAQQRLQALGYDAAGVSELQRSREALRGERDRRQREVDKLSAELSDVSFGFSDPYRGFDRSSVKGVVAKLVHVKDPDTTTALEVALGGRLFQVVIDSERTGSALLSKGELRKRVTFIPLNKIAWRDVPQRVTDAVRRLGGGRARPALELVGYDREVEAAMKFVFGSTIVCQDADTAKRLAFNKEPGAAARCVTYEGDDFNPAGTLSGGSRQNRRKVLPKVAELADAEAELARIAQQLHEVEQRLAAASAKGQEYKKYQREAELSGHSLELLRQRVADSESSQLAASLAAAEADVKKAEEDLATFAQEKKALKQQAEALKRDMAGFARERDKLLKAALDKQKRGKAGLEAAKKRQRTAEQGVLGARAEVEAAGNERRNLQEQLQALDKSLAELAGEVSVLEGQAAVLRAAQGEADARLEARRTRLRQCDEQLKARAQLKDKLNQKMQDKQVDRRRLENKMATKKTEQNAAKDRLKNLQEEHPWIANDRSLFGSGAYDFSASSPREAHATYTQQSAKLDRLKQHGVNKRAELMYETTKREVDSLREKREVVERDKGQIQQVIEQLDDKKRTALHETWQKVDRDLGAIFSTLLPGTAARLVPPADGTFLDGLEVRVAFGGVWKESLTELSGGQKSLLALSLILALCRFKPAPLYILDEVDAALDLSHTQNIGAMIKQHFPQSQFVVVSLKEGMFSNANVVFRTKFVDGVSTVARTVNTAQRNAPQHTASAGAANTHKMATSKHAAQDNMRRQPLKENVR